MLEDMLKLWVEMAKYVSLRLPSGEMRYILGECMATIGTIGNEDYANMVIR